MIPKFRAFDKKKEVLREVLHINFETENIVVDMGYADVEKTAKWNALIIKNKYVLMQSTGLKDKNGVEIFEGDIVRWKDCESIDDEIVYEDTFVVYWSDEFLMWKAKNEDTDYIDLYDYSDNRELEVIGNIYENKELLED